MTKEVKKVLDLGIGNDCFLAPIEGKCRRTRCKYLRNRDCDLADDLVPALPPLQPDTRTGRLNHFDTGINQ